MDRRQFKIISVLLALLMFVSPISSLAMQPTMSDIPSGHCEDTETDSLIPMQETLDHAQCMMDSCAENCGASRHCSSPAPIILTLHDVQIHFAGRGFGANPVPAPRLVIHPSGLYRPPRA